MSVLNFLLKVLVKLDELILARNFSYKTYEKIHVKLSYPVIRMKFFLANGYWPSLSQPKTFNEFIITDKLKSRNPLIPIIADKFLVRKYVSEKIGEQYLIPLINLYTAPEQIKATDFINGSIYKGTHASGLNLIVKDRGSMDLDKAELTVKEWFNSTYKNQILLWFTQHMERNVIVEKLLSDEHGKVPKDFKIFVVKGEVKFIQVDQDRFESHSRALYDENWNRINATYGKKNGPDVIRPKHLELMTKLAKQLAVDFDFIRVDLYHLEDKVYFGELTPYPSSGNAKFTPSNLDDEIGALLLAD